MFQSKKIEINVGYAKACYESLKLENNCFCEVCASAKTKILLEKVSEVVEKKGIIIRKESISQEEMDFLEDKQVEAILSGAVVYVLLRAQNERQDEVLKMMSKKGIYFAFGLSALASYISMVIDDMFALDGSKVVISLVWTIFVVYLFFNIKTFKEIEKNC